MHRVLVAICLLCNKTQQGKVGTVQSKCSSQEGSLEAQSDVSYCPPASPPQPDALMDTSELKYFSAQHMYCPGTPVLEGTTDIFLNCHREELHKVLENICMHQYLFALSDLAWLLLLDTAGIRIPYLT